MKGGTIMKDKINIRPTSGVYATYKRLSYQPWTAIAEFVDNSTQSYFDNRNTLKELSGFNKLVINISYFSGKEGKDSLTITDNAYGMEIEDFERAIVLDKAPKNTDGRNEFGMGLKTAACWFGTRWTVKSTQYGSEFGYSASVDVDKLEKDKDEEVDLDIFEVDPSEHYSIITIEKLNKKITGPRTIGKVRELLSSIYRQDLRTGEIIITYNDNELVFKDPTIYKETLLDGTVEDWSKDVDFTINHEGKDLRVTGFIALRIPGSVREAGFTLMRRGRVIVGGPEKNYRPVEIFGDSNSYAYQRLFGELHMDNWPVTQAKDEFDWHSSGLEEMFIEELLPLTKPYRTKAESIRVRQQVETKTIIDKTINDLQSAGVITGATATAVNNHEKSPCDNDQSTDRDIMPEAEENYDENEIVASSIDTDVIVSGPESYIMPFSYNNNDYVFKVSFDTSNPLNSWVLVNDECDTEYHITINMKHPFFKPLTENKDFMVIMTKIVIAMVLAEIDSLMISTDGKINASDIRRQMNHILEKIVHKGVLSNG
jgi:hypothetical protein